MQIITRVATLVAVLTLSASAIAAPPAGNYSGTVKIKSRLGEVENSSRSKVGVRFETDGSFVVLTESRPNNIFNSNDLIIRGRIDASGAVTLQDSTDFFSQSFRGISRTTTAVEAGQVVTTVQMTFEVRTGRFVDLPNRPRTELTKTIIFTVQRDLL